MTKQNDILKDQNYRPVLDHGFVGLVDHMGSDGAIVQAARVSYGDGTKTVNEDRGLIRYLIRHKHTSPIEMAEVKLHIKMPIFVARQWIRHRTASANEYSGRYSIMSDEFYLPTPENVQPQSQTNKQGRDGEFSTKEKEGVRWLMQTVFDQSYQVYDALRMPANEYSSEEERRDVIYDPYEPGSDGFFDENYPGLSRELARTVLPVGNYTELYWKQNLHNMLHLLHLRRDSHAQYEIRAYAEAVYDLIKPLFPLTIEAWEDYIWNGHHLSRMDFDLLNKLLGASRGEPLFALEKMIENAGSEKAMAESVGMSLRELRDFRKKWNV